MSDSLKSTLTNNVTKKNFNLFFNNLTLINT